MDNRYELETIHAVGGAGRVWLARDHQLNRKVAIKEIRDQFANNDRMWLRFAREAMITAKLEHPGIVPVYDFGKFKGKSVYCMQFVEGPSLAKEINKFHEDNRHLTTSSKLKLVQLRKLVARFVDVCNTVAYAHSNDVLHRDIKPSNILIGDYGQTLMVDWGLAKHSPGPIEKNVATSQPATIDPKESDDSLLDENSFNQRLNTSFGERFGTPGYSSPEQVRGEHKSIGQLSDVFSLGATLYTIVTGEIPSHDGSKISVSGPLGAIVKKAMAAKPDLRYQSVELLRQDMERYLAADAVEVYAEGVVEKILRICRRNSKLTAAILAGLFATCVISLFAWIQFQQRNTAELISEQREEIIANQSEFASVLQHVLHGIDLDEESIGQLKNLAEGNDPMIRGSIFSTIATHYRSQWLNQPDSPQGLKNLEACYHYLEKAAVEWRRTEDWQDPHYRVSTAISHAQVCIREANQLGPQDIKTADLKFETAVTLLEEQISFHDSASGEIQSSKYVEEALRLRFEVVRALGTKYKFLRRQNMGSDNVRKLLRELEVKAALYENFANELVEADNLYLLRFKYYGAQFKLMLKEDFVEIIEVLDQVIAIIESGAGNLQPKNDYESLLKLATTKRGSAKNELDLQKNRAGVLLRTNPR